jgi:ABC-type amino acid transport substrate-binding protein
MEIGQQAMVRREDLALLGTTEAILATHRRVGAEVGTTAMHFVREQLPRASKARFSTVAKAMEALDNHEIDVVVHDSPAIQWHAARDFDGRLAAVPGRMTRESLAWAVNKHDQKLLADVNAILAQWRRDGTLDGVIRRWLPEHD